MHFPPVVFYRRRVFSEQFEGVTGLYPVKQGFWSKSHQKVHPNVLCGTFSVQHAESTQGVFLWGILINGRVLGVQASRDMKSIAVRESATFCCSCAYPMLYILSLSVSPLPGVLASLLRQTKCTVLCTCHGMKSIAAGPLSLNCPEIRERITSIQPIDPVYHGGSFLTYSWSFFAYSEVS